MSEAALPDRLWLIIGVVLYLGAAGVCWSGICFARSTPVALSDTQQHGLARNNKIRIGVMDAWPTIIPDDRIKAVHQKWAGSKGFAQGQLRLATDPDGQAPGRKSSNMTANGRQWLPFILLVTVSIALALPALIWTPPRDRVAMGFGSAWFKIAVVTGLAFFVVAVSGLGWILMDRMKQAVLKDVESHLKLVLALIRDRSDMWLDERTALMARFGKNPALVEMAGQLLEMSPDNEAMPNAEALAGVRQFFQTSPALFHTTDFFLINKSRINIGAMHNADLGKRNRIADQFSSLIDRAFQGKVGFIPPQAFDSSTARQTGQTDRPFGMFFIIPVQDIQAQTLAVMGLKIDPAKDLAKLTRFPGRWKTDDIYAFDRTGRMITPSRFETQLAGIGLLAPGHSSVMTIELRDPGVDLTRKNQRSAAIEKRPLTLMAHKAMGLRKQMMDPSVNRDESPMQSNTTGYRDYRGVKVFGAWLWDRDLDMGFAAEIDVAEAMEGFNQVKLTVCVVLGVTLILSVASVLLVLVLGDRSRKTLETAKDNLEDKVAERTRELQENQERFAALLESAPDAMVVCDESGSIVLVNSRTEQLFGYNRSELENASVDMLVPDDIREHHPRKRQLFHHSRTVQQKAAAGLELTARNLTGRLIPVEVSLSTIHNRSGHNRSGHSRSGHSRSGHSRFGHSRSGVLVVASIRDITERKKMAQALNYERERLQGILDASPVGVAISSNKILRFANPQFCAMFDARQEAPTPDFYVDPKDRDRIMAILDAGGRIENKELKLYSKDRKVRDMLVSFISVDFQATPGILGWFLDITDRKRTEQKIRDKYEELSRFRQLAVGRENKMIQLKEEINTLSGRLGEPSRYKIVGKEENGGQHV